MGKLYVKSLLCPGSEKIVGIQLDPGQGIVGWVAENRKSQIIYDTSVDQRFAGKKTIQQKP